MRRGQLDARQLHAIGGLVPLVNIARRGDLRRCWGRFVRHADIRPVVWVFIAGLMVGRTPEYLGKKIEALRDQDGHALHSYIATLHSYFTALVEWSAPYGASELAQQPGSAWAVGNLYAIRRRTGNNGSAFAGLNANTPFYNLTIGLAMLTGRFALHRAGMALAGSLASKKRTIVTGPGTFPTNGAAFHRSWSA